MTDMSLISLEPVEIWRQFIALSQVPRPSKHEEKVQQFMLDFAQAHGLEAERDEIGNIILRKGATPGMENTPGIILQGHLDMVPQADSDCSHDFTRDPIELIVDGEWLRANRTTLGADNGVGVAAAMAVLASDDIAHGPLEALFTCNEEAGMDGAFGLKPGTLQGEILINMDSEDEGVLFIGCAGGVEVKSSLTYDPVSAPRDYVAFDITVSGLLGGHSGVDIHRGRGNANQVLFRLLRAIVRKIPIKIGGVSGGSLNNAIPREATATILVPPDQKSSVESICNRMRQQLVSEFEVADPGLQVGLMSANCPASCLGAADGEKLVALLSAFPSGVMRMSDTMPGLVETSTNLAIVTAGEGRIEIISLIRSSVDSARDAVCESLFALVELAGGKSRLEGAYPGWKPNPTSPVLKVVSQAHERCFDKAPEVGAIHAGLECGIIGASHPDLDMISFGPTIRFPHSPGEKVHIDSVQRFWRLLVATLGSIPLHQ